MKDQHIGKLNKIAENNKEREIEINLSSETRSAPSMNNALDGCARLPSEQRVHRHVDIPPGCHTVFLLGVEF